MQVSIDHTATPEPQVTPTPISVGLSPAHAHNPSGTLEVIDPLSQPDSSGVSTVQVLTQVNSDTVEVIDPDFQPGQSGVTAARILSQA